MLRERLLRCAELAGRVNEALDFDCAPHPRRSAFGSTASIQVWQPKVGSPPVAAGRRCDPANLQSISHNALSITASRKAVTACKSQELCKKN
jgi:hypothetical protein